MTPWKFTDASNTVAFRTLDDGGTESRLASALPAGETVLPADPLPILIPQSVTMRQARLALMQSNLLAQVDVIIAAMTSPQKEAAQIEWQYSSEVHRHKALVLSLGPALGLNDAQLDQLFITAATL